MGLEAIMVMWPVMFETNFHPNIPWRKFGSNSLVFFDEKKFENV